MGDDQDVNTGFSALIRKPQSSESTASPRGGAGITQIKSDQQVSGYRDLVRRQLERRKLGKTKLEAPSPTSKNLVSNKHPQITEDIQLISSKSSIEEIDPLSDLHPSLENQQKNFIDSFNSIETNTPDAITSIEIIEPTASQNISINTSIESFDPLTMEVTSQKIDTSNFITHDTFVTSVDASHVSSDDAPTETIYRAKDQIFTVPSQLETDNRETQPNFVRSDFSIEDDKPACETRLNNSIEKFIPTNLPEPSSKHSIENINPSLDSSIEIFDPIIPLSDSKVYSFKLAGNYTKLAHSILKNIDRFDDTKTLYLYLYLYRLSYGWNKNVTQIPLSQYFIKDALGYSKNTVAKCLKKLTALKLIEEKEIVARIGTVYHVRYVSNQTQIEDAVPEKNYLSLDNNFFELKSIPPTTKILYLYLYKESYGFGKNYTGKLLTSEIAKHLKLTTRTIQESIRELISKRFIIRPDSIFSSNGIIYRVLLPQEIEVVKTKTPINFELKQNMTWANTGEESKTSIEAFKPSPLTSIETNQKNGSSKSIESFDQTKNDSLQTIDISNQDLTNSSVSIETIGHKESKTIINKTSSEQSDDVLNFFNEQTKAYSSFSFTISRKKVSEILDQHAPEYLKAVFTKMIPAMMREGVTNPVGLYLHALETPESYAMLQKPSAQETAEQKRYENLIEAREKSFADEYKRIIEKSVDAHWQTLEEQERQTLIDERRKLVGQGQDFAIPDVVVKRSAMEHSFWNHHKQAWEQLLPEDKVIRANKARQSMIERIYTQANNEGRGAVPDPLPPREFLKSINEMAEKLAMISAGKSR